MATISGKVDAVALAIFHAGKLRDCCVVVIRPPRGEPVYDDALILRPSPQVRRLGIHRFYFAILLSFTPFPLGVRGGFLQRPSVQVALYKEFVLLVAPTLVPFGVSRIYALWICCWL